MIELSANELDSFVLNLKKKKLIPQNLEISIVGNTFEVAVFDSRDNLSISPNVMMGSSTSIEIAILKSLVEYVERKVMENFLAGCDTCFWRRSFGSDGTAAFPSFLFAQNLKSFARDNAYSEALERYVWAEWWEHESIAAKIYERGVEDLSGPEESDYLRQIVETVEVKKIYEIRPKINIENYIVIIYFAELKDGGFVSGGAAGAKQFSNDVSNRAMSELMRHCLALRKILNHGGGPSTIYESRLYHFGTGQGRELVLNKLARQGHRTLNIPSLAVDEQITHADQDIVIVHQCLFEGQRPFLGGELERLCL